MRKFVVALVSVLLLAATPGDVTAELPEQGFYIESGSSATASVVGDAVAEGRFDGGQLYVVVLSEEPPSSATFFAEAVLDDLGGAGTVLTVAPESVGFASENDIWSKAELESAVDASLSGSSDDNVVALFIESLTGSDIDPGATPGTPSGGGGSGFIWFVVIVGGLVALFFYLRRNTSRISARSRMNPQIAQFQEAARSKLSDIANDILEMEDEVGLSDNVEAKRHYQEASATYADLIDKVGHISSAGDLVDIIYRLDVAIWELDAAEALLDHKPVPEKPERPRVETTPSAQPEVTTQIPGGFDRRPQRQSTPAGPDLGNILMAILAMQNMGGFGRRGGQSGTWGQPGSGPPMGGGGPIGGGRIRGGGRRRG